MEGLVLAVVNQKGGVGKTTTVANTAVALALAGRRVLVIDLDPQGSLTLSFGIGKHEVQGASMADALAAANSRRRPLEAVIREVNLDAGAKVSVAPANQSLSIAEFELYSRGGHPEAYTLLRQALAPARRRYDYILIDCRPDPGPLTTLALAAADAAVIPVKTEYLSIAGIPDALTTIDKVREHLNPALRVLGILATMHQPHTSHGSQTLSELRKRFDGRIRVFDSVIPQSVRFAETTLEGQPAVIYYAGTKQARAYAEFAAEVEAVVTQAR